MAAADVVRTISPAQALERLSVGEHIQSTRIAGLLDLDPLVVSRWLCGEDMRGVYQPIVLRDCILDGLDLEGRTFYEMVELAGCRVALAHFNQAYFYSMLMIEDCIFEADFNARGIQSDGRLVVHNTVFAGWAEFDEISLRGRVDLAGVSFLGGTNLLHALLDGAPTKSEQEINLSGCGFRAADVPDGLDLSSYGVVPIVTGNVEQFR